MNVVITVVFTVVFIIIVVAIDNVRYDSSMLMLLLLLSSLPLSLSLSMVSSINSRVIRMCKTRAATVQTQVQCTGSFGITAVECWEPIRLQE